MNSVMKLVVPDIYTMEEAVKVAVKVERMEAALKELKSELKTFVEREGSIETGEKVWAYSTYTSWEFDQTGLAELADQLAIEGINPWEIMTIPAAELRKIGWSDDMLAQFGQKKETKRFSSKSKKK